MTYLKQSTSITYLKAKLSKLVQINMLASSDSFLQRILQEQKELSKLNKKHFFLFHKCSLLDLQYKLAKMWRTQPLINSPKFA